MGGVQCFQAVCGSTQYIALYGRFGCLPLFLLSPCMAVAWKEGRCLNGFNSSHTYKITLRYMPVRSQCGRCTWIFNCLGSCSSASLAMKDVVPHLCPPDLNALKNPVPAVWQHSYPVSPTGKCPSLNRIIYSIWEEFYNFFFNNWMENIKPVVFEKNSHARAVVCKLFL